VDGHGNAYGRFESCGVRPRLGERLQSIGIELPANMFQRRVLETPSMEKEKK
jgi:hypothetical protein